MKRYLVLIALLGTLSNCTKDSKVEEVLSNLKLNQKEFSADGQSTISMSVELSNNSSSDRRNIIFSSSGGVFIGSGNNKYTSKAEFENGILVAKAVLKSSTQPGTIKITAQPEFDSPIKEFVLTDSVIARPSSPFSIKLEPSSFGIASNFLNEVQLLAFLKNSSGRFVSKGNSVLFEDILLAGSAANGRFRSVQNITADSSKVSAIYSANAYPIGTTIKIKATVLDANGIRTPIADSLLLNVNQ